MPGFSDGELSNAFTESEAAHTRETYSRLTNSELSAKRNEPMARCCTRLMQLNSLVVKPISLGQYSETGVKSIL